MHFARLAFFLILLFSPLAKAGGSFAEFSYKLLNGDCPKSEATSTPKDEACTDPKILLAKDMGKLSEFAYLAGLAGERADSLSCTSNQINAVFDSPEQMKTLTDDVMTKIKTIAEARRREQQVKSSIVGSAEMSAEHRKARLLAEETLASIPFIDLPEFRTGIEGLIANIQNLDGQEITPDMLNWSEDQFKKMLTSSRGVVAKDLRLMKEASEKMGATLSGAQRESLAQDTDLVETYRQRHPEVELTMKPVACRVDAKYGRGAGYRDVAVAVGLTVVTGPGAAAAVRMAPLLSSITGWAARGSMAKRSASLLRMTALAAGESANAASTIYDIHKACDERAGHSGGSLGANDKRSCDTNVAKSLEASNCYLAHGLGAIGFAGTALVATSKVFDKFKAIEKVASVSPQTAAKTAEPVARASGEIPKGRALDWLNKLGFKASAVDLQAEKALQPITLELNQIKKGSIAGYMKKSAGAGVEYVFDDARFAGRGELALSEGNKVYLRTATLKELDTARSREVIIYETEKALARAKCLKSSTGRDCGKAIEFKALGEGKFNIAKREDEFSSGDYEALKKSGNGARNPDSARIASSVAEEEAQILSELNRSFNTFPDHKLDLEKKAYVQTVKLKDFREIEVSVPFGDVDPKQRMQTVKRAVKERLAQEHVQNALKSIDEKKAAKMAKRRAVESVELAEYKPSFKIVDGQIISDYRPTKTIPRSKYPAQPTDAKLGGRIFRSIDGIKAYRNSDEWKDGTHVFLQIEEPAKGPDGKPVVVWMESHRVPTGQDLEDGKIITHRTLANFYEKETGHPPKIIGGGEYTADMTRTVYKIGDGMGTYHREEIEKFEPTVFFSADTMNAQGMKFSSKSQVVPFRVSDEASHMVGHVKAEKDVAITKEIDKNYPGLLPKMRTFSQRLLTNERSLMDTEAKQRLFRREYLDSPALKADTERYAAYRLLSDMGQLMPESSTLAVQNTLTNIQLDTELRKDVNASLKLIDKYADDYFRDMKRVTRGP